MTADGGGWPSVRAVGAALTADRPSALELVVGPDRFPAVLARAFGAWLVVVPGSSLVALLLPRPHLDGGRLGSPAAVSPRERPAVAGVAAEEG